MKFRTQYTEHINFYAPEGRKEQEEYMEYINPETGKKELRVSGMHNIHEMIQAAKEGTMIKNILEKFTAGDINALEKRPGHYIDITTAPKNLHEANQVIVKITEDFYKLPIEIRKEYNHSVDEYIAAAQNEKEFDEKLTTLYQNIMEKMTKTDAERKDETNEQE